MNKNKMLLSGIMLLLTIPSYGNNKCFLKGTIPEIQNIEMKDLNIKVEDQESKIINNYYCIKNKPMFNPVLVKLYYKTTFLFDNKINYNMTKEKQDITIDNWIKDVLCKDRLCKENEIKEIKTGKKFNKLKNKLYKKLSSPLEFNYKKEDENIKRYQIYLNKKNVKKEDEEKFDKTKYIELHNLKGMNYNGFKYSDVDKDYYLNDFKNNQNGIKGLTNKELSEKYIASNFIRALYYNGQKLDEVGALYSTNYKNKIIENNDFEKPLILTKLYTEKFRDNVLIRKPIDERAYKHFFENYGNKFKKVGNKIILNTKERFIELIYENGSWRLNTFY